MAYYGKKAGFYGGASSSFTDGLRKQHQEHANRIEQEEEDKQREADEKKASERKKGGRNLTRRIWDTVNFVDSGRSWGREDPDEEGAKKNSIEQLGDAARSFGRNAAELANTAAEAGRVNMEAARGVVGLMTDNEEAALAAARRAKDKSRSYLEEGRGLLGVGGEKTIDEYQDISAKDLTKNIVGEGLAVYGEIGPGFSKGGRLSNRIVRGVAEGATQGAIGDIGEQLLDDEDGINLGQTARSAAFGGGLGGVMSSIGGKEKPTKKSEPTTTSIDEVAKELSADDLESFRSNKQKQVDRQILLNDTANQIASETPSSNNLLPAPRQGVEYQNNRTPEQIKQEMQKLQNGEYGDEFLVSSNNGTSIDSPDYSKERETLSKQYDKEIDELSKSKKTEQWKSNRAAEIDEKYTALNDELDARYSVNSELSGTGTSTNVNVDAIRTRFAELQDELQRSEEFYNNLETDEFIKTRNAALSSAEDPAMLRQQLSDIDNGNLPETAMRDADPTAQLSDIVDNDFFPEEARQAASIVQNQMNDLRLERNSLLVGENYDAAATSVDMRYQDRLAEIQEMPPYRQEQELASLEANYAEQLDALNKQRDIDLERVDELDEALDMVAERQARILDDARQFESQAGGRRVPDELEVEAMRGDLQTRLDNANRFDNPGMVVAEVAESPNPQRVFDESPDVQENYKADVQNNMDKTPSVTQDKYTGSNKSLAVLRLLSPSRIFDSFGEGFRQLHTNLVRAESNYNLANKADAEVLTRISDVLNGNTNVQKQIVEFIEGKRQTLSAIEDREAAEMIQSWLKEKGDILKENGFATIDEFYFPHVFDKTSDKANTLFKGRNTGEVKFGNLKSRLDGNNNYSREIMDVLAGYSDGFNRKIYFEPSIKALADLPTQIKLADADARWLQEYVDQLSGFRREGEGFNSFMDKVFTNVGRKDLVGKNHYTNTLATQRMVSALATMGLNPGTAVRNLTQGVNTVAEIGPVNATVGLKDTLLSLAAGPNSPQWKELAEVGVIDGGVSQDFYSAITKPGYRGNVAGKARGAANMMMSMIRSTDIMLRSQAYYGAKRMAEKQGLTGKAAQDFAIEKVINSQFMTSKLDMPVKLNGQAVRSVTQLATFSAKQAEFLKHQLKLKDNLFVKSGNNYKFNPQKAGYLIGAGITAAVATEALKPVIGFNEKEWIPFYDQVAPFIDKNASGDGLYRSPIIQLMFGDGKGKMGFIEAMQSKNPGEFWNDNWSALIPGGTQIKKTMEGSETTESGVSLDRNGNVRYLQGTDEWDKLRATLFGQYATQEGQDWIRGGFQKLNEKQSNKVLSRDSRADEQLYMDFYTAKNNVSGRQDAYNQVVAAAKEGNYNKAKRLADEYNQQVSEAMGSFWSNHDDMPQELRDELNKTYINPDNIYEKNNR